MLDLVTLSSLGLGVARRLKASFEEEATIHLHADVGTSEDVLRFSRTADLVERIFSTTGGIVLLAPAE